MTNFIPDGSNDHRLQMSTAALFTKLTAYVEGRQMDQRAVAGLQQIATDHAHDARKVHGIDFPSMVVMPFPGIRYMHLVRADIEVAGLVQVLLNVQVKYPEVTKLDLAAAVRLAFPQHAAKIGIGENAKRDPFTQPLQ